MGFWAGEGRCVWELDVERDTNKIVSLVNGQAKGRRNEPREVCCGRAGTPGLSIAEHDAMRLGMMECQEESSRLLSQSHRSWLAASRSTMVMDSPHRGQRHEL